ncbi:MAG: pseudouridine synthase [Candidatus Babeliales bacterium]
MVETKNSNKDHISLSKYIAHTGFCSRRKATILIKDGQVAVNNNIITDPGHKIAQADKVKVQGKLVKLVEERLYILLNKPKDYITTLSDEAGRRTVIDLIKQTVKQRVYPVGRLDRNTTGLLLLTNDGQLAHKLMHPRYQIKKTYHAVLEKPLQDADVQKIKSGVILPDGEVVVDEISFIAEKPKNYVRLMLHSGKYRIVRRLFEKLGYLVSKLDRVEYAGLTKKKLPVGAWRYLTEQEVILLKKI